MRGDSKLSQLEVLLFKVSLNLWSKNRGFSLSVGLVKYSGFAFFIRSFLFPTAANSITATERQQLLEDFGAQHLQRREEEVAEESNPSEESPSFAASADDGTGGSVPTMALTSGSENKGGGGGSSFEGVLRGIHAVIEGTRRKQEEEAKSAAQEQETSSSNEAGGRGLSKFAYFDRDVAKK